jgi:glycine dehydrogenase
MKININNREAFEGRHIGPDSDQLSKMLSTIGVPNLDQLIDETVPDLIRLKKPLDLPKAKSEFNFLKDFKQLAKKNKIFKSYLGNGYFDTITPGVILRNILENPAWYTAYTPYQAEIAQGRLEALLNFQTMIIDLTGMELANASLLDEATAAAEAMTMLHSLRKANKQDANTYLVSEN